MRTNQATSREGRVGSGSRDQSRLRTGLRQIICGPHSERPAISRKIISDDDEEVQEAHKAELKTDEKRKVEFVRLALTDDKKLAGKSGSRHQEASDRANDFPGPEKARFTIAAKSLQLPVQLTAEFAAAAPDPQLNVDPQLGPAAFKLSMQEPNSDPIQVADGFYILHLDGIIEARPLTIEEAKPKIVEAIKTSRTRELMSTKGAEIVHQLREATKSGQPLESTIQKAGVKVEKVPPFSLLDETAEAQDKEAKKESPELVAIKNAMTYLNLGEMSDFLPLDDSGLIAILEKREPSADANDREKRAAFESRVLNNRRQIVFYEWLRDRQLDAGLQFSKG